MNRSIEYRGPDAGDIWLDPEAQLALAHRRLAIVDLTEAGAQPMHTSCGRYIIIYNGEVYNAEELRRDLEKTGRVFRGHSDTEVILEGISEWGLLPTMQRLIGMFAIAVWDRQLRSLSLVRDRLGIKPIYWGRFGKLFMFASELKALRVVPGWTPEIDRNSVASFLRHNYIPAPYSIYKGVYKLEQGTILTIAEGGEPAIQTFWDMDTVVERGFAARAGMDRRSDDDVIAQLDALLSDAVARRMIADVPFGAFLSGGIDSSTVVALMQKSSAAPVRTFSIGFHERGYNEAEHASAIARHLKTEHTELYLSSNDALAVIPMLPTIYDEPFSDSSQIPTFLVSQMTRQHVTVALSGDGGDELFAGYNRYLLGNRLRRDLGYIPGPVRLLGAGTINSISPQSWDAIGRFIPRLNRIQQFGDKMHKLAKLLGNADAELYRHLVSHADRPNQLVPGAQEHDSLLMDPAVSRRIPDYIERMQYLDTRTYLPDDILTKLDRASMAVSLEARLPLLDHRVVEFSWSLPMRFKLRDGKTKWILREVLKRYVPESLFERPKMGFGVPIDRWLRGPLRDWAEGLLSESALGSTGLVDPKPIRQYWSEHLSGRQNWQYHLWDILMLQAWQRHANIS